MSGRMAVKENKGLLPHLSSSVCRFSFTQFTYALSAPRAPGMPATQRQPQRAAVGAPALSGKRSVDGRHVKTSRTGTTRFPVWSASVPCTISYYRYSYE